MQNENCLYLITLEIPNLLLNLVYMPQSKDFLKINLIKNNFFKKNLFSATDLAFGKYCCYFE